MSHIAILPLAMRAPHGYWYCHVQRDFRPYAPIVNAAIEEGYSQYLGGGSGLSQAFELEAGIYVVDFERLIQIAHEDASRYRTVRRLGLSLPLSARDYANTRIPLTYSQILAAGGHPENYLTSGELSAGRVVGEQDAGFFPEVIAAAGVVEDSLG